LKQMFKSCFIKLIVDTVKIFKNITEASCTLHTKYRLNISHEYSF
jgi:hypothetical protein